MTTSSGERRFLTYADLVETCYALGGGEAGQPLVGHLEGSHFEYRSRAGRWNERGIEKVKERIRVDCVRLVNQFLGTNTCQPTEVATLILDRRAYVPVCWAIAQAIEGALIVHTLVHGISAVRPVRYAYKILSTTKGTPFRCHN